ncbi:hypothetical protein PAXRUDRAFT_827023 [Paxillus rubicundulus Ve08.2h10]|uniref:Uncharacterized protein n=1 Tax=Paxillus rubicundulus Ve08.2h10 TaxID=930991 RepID=A0A0D0DDQ1_9AGAM|nr:hypothetical protein PAXRUDRAFT_827023 [Paxillus rubicundulus Ve08.2h10]
MAGLVDSDTGFTSDSTATWHQQWQIGYTREGTYTTCLVYYNSLKTSAFWTSCKHLRWIHMTESLPIFDVETVKGSYAMWTRGYPSMHIGMRCDVEEPRVCIALVRRPQG